MFRVELRDTAFNILEILDNEVINLRWVYSRIGGCGGFSFSLPRKLYEEKSISGDFNIRIYYRNPDTKVYDLWYQGLVENKYPQIKGNSEEIAVSGHGYQAQLSRVYIDKTYTAQEVSVIVKDILDTFVTPNTDITYNVSDIVATTFTPDTLEFHTDTLSALQTCADIVGSREWGVDANRKFFFKAKSTTVDFRWPLGAKITNFSEDLDFKEIINRIIVQGAETAGVIYTTTYNDSASKLKYNLRTKVIQNSAISTNAVAAQFATSTFAEYSEVVRKASCELINYEAQIEATVPINLAVILTREITYGIRKYGTFLYSGLVNRQINRINYAVNNNNTLKISLDLGQLRPTLAEEIAQLEYQLEQQRSAAL